jgi:hypothetical protein
MQDNLPPADFEAELVFLGAEVDRLNREKEDLEILLDTVTRHSTFIENQLEQTVQDLEHERLRLAAEHSLTDRLSAALKKAGLEAASTSG